MIIRMCKRFGVLIVLVVVSAAVIIVQAAPNQPAKLEVDPVSVIPEIKQKPVRQKAKGIYLTASSAANSKKLAQMIALIDTTELNAVVIDTKDYTGKILYPSSVPLAVQLKTVKPVMTDVAAIIKQLHEKNIYVIARQTVFQDPALASAKPALAIKSKKGGLWRDNLGLSWVDPTNREVWDYNVDIAKEAIALGFDEINFDYVRFPTDGDLRQAVFATSTARRYENMANFYQYISNALADEPAYISLDFFGFVMERHDGMSIGQRLVDAVEVVDYISPMMYPSHYPKGYLNLDNPAAYPGAVIANGMKQGIGYFTSSTRAEVRPWLQAFHMGAYYNASKIRAQIDAVEKHPNGGWLLWNASNNYTANGLKKE